jgi:pimeloyl-ACP methyl ester carboxylesterase
MPVEKAQRLADGLPDGALVLIPGAGHAANLTHPEPVSPEIERFLAGLS